MTVKEHAEKHKAEGIQHWYCPDCGRIMSVIEYVSLVCDVPCRCGMFISGYMPRVASEDDNQKEEPNA